MLVRLVHMTFSRDSLESFLELFDERAAHIRAFPGCRHLELWRDVDAPAACTTYSQWTDEKSLEAYRTSDLFQSTWSAVKPLFDAPARARSYSVAREAARIEDAARTLDESSGH